MATIRYSPFTGVEPFPGLTAFQDTMNRLFAEPNGRHVEWSRRWTLLKTRMSWWSSAECPGRLSSRGYRREDRKRHSGPCAASGTPKKTSEKGGWHRMERSYGSFERAFTLPETVDPEYVKADYKNGTLTVTLPKKEIAKPRQVKAEVNHN